MGKLLKKGIISLLSVLILVLCTLPVKAENRTIRILFTSGLLAQLDPILEVNENGETIQTGGFAGLAGMIASQKNDATLVLDAGDFSYGTSASVLIPDGTVLSLLKQMGYDAVMPGEKDFSYDHDSLVSMWNAPVEKPYVVLDNVSLEGTDIFLPSLLLECGPVQVGIFGVMSDSLSGDGISVQDPLESASASVKALQAAGAQYIIAMCHDAAREDTSRLCDILADKIEGIDLIINGHQDEMTSSPSRQKDTWIVNGDSQGRNLGVLDIDVDARTISSCQYVRIDPSLADESVLTAVNDAREQAKAKLRALGQDPDQTAGASDHVYTDPNDEQSDTRDFIMDALSDAWNHQTALPGRYAVSLAGADELVMSLPNGQITAMNLLDTGLAGNDAGSLSQPLYGAYVKGSDLRKICEIDYHEGQRNALSQLAMGRMKYTVLDQRLAMNQVVDVYVRETDKYWAKVSDDAYYPLVYTARVKQILDSADTESRGILQVTLYGDPKAATSASDTPLKASDGTEMNALWAEMAYLESFPRGENAVHTLAGQYQSTIQKVTAVKMNVHNYFVHTSRFGWMVYLGIVGAVVLLIIIVRIFAWIYNRLHPSQAGDD